jgi:hypothetical protein
MLQAPLDRGSKRSVVVHHVNKARHFPLLAVSQSRQYFHYRFINVPRPYACYREYNIAL